MVLCFVPSCKNRSDRQNWKQNVSKKNRTKITFHSFPKNATIRSLWLDILNIKITSIPTGARICSTHFHEKFFDRTSSITRLRSNALPFKKSLTETLLLSNLPLATKNFSDIVSTIENVEEVANISISNLETKNTANLNHEASVSVANDSTVQSSISKADKATMVSPDLIYNSPEKCRLRQEIKYMKEKNAKKTSFPHPVTSEKIVVFPDPCYILKLIRNSFGDLENMIDNDNQQIRWSYINQLHLLQQNKGSAEAGVIGVIGPGVEGPIDAGAI